jgi:hypothetical protein
MYDVLQRSGVSALPWLTLADGDKTWVNISCLCSACVYKH